MKSLVLAATLALFAGPAFADEVVVTPGATIEHRAADETIVKEKSVRHDTDGCATKSMTKTNGEGDSVTKTKTNC